MKRIVILLYMTVEVLYGQIPGSKYTDGLKFYLNQDSSSWFKATFTMQTWVRYTENNPGSTVNHYPQSNETDIGLRRARIQLMGRISSRVFLYSQIGINSFDFISQRKPGLFFHDITGEYTIWERKLTMGTGLTGYTGLSRYAAPGISNIMMYDAPLFQQATNDVTDQFLRKLSVYAKGKLSKFDYRLIVSKPMNIATASTGLDTTLSARATFSPEYSNLQYQGYFMWQFLDQESNQIAFTAGTYLGTKRIFNIGMGFINQAKAMRYLDNNNIKSHTSLNMFAADVYLDYYLNKQKQNAINAYAGYFKYNFGPYYLRPFNTMNTANGSNINSIQIFSGFGNAFPMVGTGDIFYFQSGYLFRKNLLGKRGTLLPNADIMFAKYTALKNPMIVYDIGLGYLIHGHNSKLCINYQSRPVFTQNLNDSSGLTGVELKNSRKGMLVLLYQIAL